MAYKSIMRFALFATISFYSFCTFAAIKTCVHGNSAQFETPEKAGSIIYKGWGVDYSKPGVFNWLHYSIPVNNSNRYLKSVSIKFFLGSHDVTVKDVHLYNANAKIHSANNVNWNSSGWSQKTITLSQRKNVGQGLGISIKTGAGVESMSHRIIFSGVCATFE